MKPENHLMPRSRAPRLIRRAALAALTSAAAAALAGCGTAATTATSNIAGRGTTPRTDTSSTTSAATSTTTGVACRAADLVLLYLGGQGATGHGELSFALRNRSRRPCHARGYPGVRFLDRAGRPLPIATIRGTRDFFGHSPLRALAVAPGASLSFRLDVSHGSGSPGVCPTAAALAVIPPGDTHGLSTSITGGAYVCARAIVSPLQPGLAARS